MEHKNISPLFVFNIFELFYIVFKRAQSPDVSMFNCRFVYKVWYYISVYCGTDSAWMLFLVSQSTTFHCPRWINTSKYILNVLVYLEKRICQIVFPKHVISSFGPFKISKPNVIVKLLRKSFQILLFRSYVRKKIHTTMESLFLQT